MTADRPARWTLLLAAFVAAAALAGADRPSPNGAGPAVRVNAPLGDDRATARPASPPVDASRSAPAQEPLAASPLDSPELRQAAARTLPTIALFALASLVPAGVLMATAFVRINIVLVILRQALGSPQIPGNQVLSALALLLTGVVMMPAFEQVYDRGVAPYAEGRLPAMAAWNAGTEPLKVFMIDQIVRTGHQDYLYTLYDHAHAGDPAAAEPTEYGQFPLRVVAPAFLLSELTTALVIGFAIYLPFLVVDLVVSAVLAAMGLFMLPPTLVALPLKLILFVLADGWMLVADMLIRSFELRGTV